MNKKSIRNRTSKPVEKTLPAAVHAAAMSLDGDTPGGSSAPFVVAEAHGSAADGAASPHQTEPQVADEQLVEPPADVPAPEAASARPKKAEKPGKPVKLSFTLPGDEARLFDALRETHQLEGAKLKKSVLVRAALLALAEADESRIAQIVASLDPVKPAAPKAAKGKSKGKK